MAAIGSKYQKIEVSFCGKIWETVHSTSKGGDLSWSYDLTQAAGFAANSGRVYIRLSGSEGYGTENGILMRDFGMTYTLADDNLYTDPAGASIPGKLAFHAGSAKEEMFLKEDNHSALWNVDEFRFIDGADSYFVYGVDVGSAMTGGSLSAKIKLVYQKIEVSFDGADWKTVYENANGGDMDWTQRLTDVEGFEANTGKVYVRFSGAPGYTGGFGIGVTDFGLDCALADGASYSEPTGIA